MDDTKPTPQCLAHSLIRQHLLHEFLASPSALFDKIDEISSLNLEMNQQLTFCQRSPSAANSDSSLHPRHIPPTLVSAGAGLRNCSSWTRESVPASHSSP
jgi:hypothetical protein